MLEEKDIQKLKEIFATKDDLKNFATKDDLKNFATKDDLKNFATKDDLKNLELKIDSKLEDHFYHNKQILLAMQADINDKFNSIMRMNTEDLVAVSDKEEKLEKRVDKLELKVNSLQTKFA